MTARLLALATTTGLLLAGTLVVPVASAHAQPDHVRPVHARPAPDLGVVALGGTVATPVTYTPAQLAALTQTTLPDLRNARLVGRTVTGTLLAPLVTTAAPVLPDAKNAALRVTLTVSGGGHRAVAVTLGELARGNGNHPALLVPAAGASTRHPAVDLVFPGDRGYSRTVRHVRSVTVAVAAPDLPTDVVAGDLRLVAGRRVVTLTAADLGRLPVVTRTVAFQSGQGSQQHVESGPTLARVLRAAHLRTGPATTVAAIAGDGYVATVTPAEATAGRRTLLVSTAADGVPLEQPRLVTDGDVSGGRYVTGVLALEVSPPAHCR